MVFYGRMTFRNHPQLETSTQPKCISLSLSLCLYLSLFISLWIQMQIDYDAFRDVFWRKLRQSVCQYQTEPQRNHQSSWCFSTDSATNGSALSQYLGSALKFDNIGYGEKGIWVFCQSWICTTDQRGAADVSAEVEKLSRMVKDVSSRCFDTFVVWYLQQYYSYK